MKGNLTKATLEKNSAIWEYTSTVMTIFESCMSAELGIPSINLSSVSLVYISLG